MQLLLAHWSVRQKLNHVSSVQLRRSVHALRLSLPPAPKTIGNWTD